MFNETAEIGAGLQPQDTRRLRALSYDDVAQYSDLFKFALGDIAWERVACRRNQTRLALPFPAKLPISRPGRPRGRPRDNHHAGLKREIRGEEMHQTGATPDHVAGVAGLAQLAVDPRLQFQRLRITDLLRGNDHGSERRTAVERLGRLSTWKSSRFSV